MELEQLIPEKATWKRTIEGEGETREFTLVFREFDLDDESWLKRTYGDELKEKFEKMDMDAISRIAFHQLENESKKELMKLKFLGWDEDTDTEIEIAKTGREKLCKICKGYSDQLELLKILLKVRGFSMPIIEDIIEESGDELGNELKTAVKEEFEGHEKK